jgi:hypothetical protein
MREPFGIRLMVADALHLSVAERCVSHDEDRFVSWAEFYSIHTQVGGASDSTMRRVVGGRVER